VAVEILSYNFCSLLWLFFIDFVQIHCVKEVELRGLGEVGIYRVPGYVCSGEEKLTLIFSARLMTLDHRPRYC